jgi:hypothetical protein
MHSDQATDDCAIVASVGDESRKRTPQTAFEFLFEKTQGVGPPTQVKTAVPCRALKSGEGKATSASTLHDTGSTVYYAVFAAT